MDLSATLKNTEGEKRQFFWRVMIASAGILVLVSILIGRLAQLQAVQHDYFVTRADDNRMRLKIVAGVRGLIHDRNGVLLAQNLPAYRLELTPEQIPDLDDTLQRLGELVHIGEHDIARYKERTRRSPPFQSSALRLRLDPTEVARLEVDRLNFPGVAVTAGLTRSYPLGSSAAHVVGYVGGITAADLDRTPNREDYRGATHIGKTGIERQYESLLHGAPGSKLVEANAAGRSLRELEYTRPTPGRDLVLSIDALLQTAIETEFAGRRGAAVALEVATGEVLALVSLPTYDPHLFVDGISHKNYGELINDADQPLFNRATQGRYPPGSTVKPFMALAGLEHDTVATHTKIHCPGFFQLPDKERKHRDWKRRGHGHVDLNRAIAESCDVYFYDLAHRLGIDHIHAFLAKFGLGESTGLDLPGEGSGLLPSREWKRATRNESWFPGETVNVGIGQGFLGTTPMQLAQITARLALRGRGYRPHLLRATRDALKGTTEARKSQQLEPVSLRAPSDWAAVHQAMVAVVHAAYGTARRVGLDSGFEIAGKTGTAQVSGLSQEDDEAPQLEDVPEQLRDHSLFIAYAPADAPRVAVAVIVEHSGSGSAVAAPIARRILDLALRTPDV